MKLSRTTRFTLIALPAAGLLVAGLTVASAEAATVTKIGVSSASPLPARATDTTVQALARTSTVSPRTDTPNGFTLVGTRRSDYVYDSDKAYQGAYECSGSSCILAAEVTAQLHEYVIGGSSHTWQLTMNMAKYANARGLTWSYSSSYWCGVNVSGGNDYICTNGAAPSNASMSVNTVVNKPWGATNSITTFPMVQANTVFSDGVHVSTKFRGWDTLSRSSTTRLNTSSGTGN